MEKMIHNRKREAKFTRIFFLAAGIFLFYQICRTVYELAAGGRELSGILFRLALIIPASVALCGGKPQGTLHILGHTF